MRIQLHSLDIFQNMVKCSSTHLCFGLPSLIMQQVSFNITIPDGVEIQTDNAIGRGLFATKQFRKGETMFTFPTFFLPNKPGTITMTTDQGEKIEIDVFVVCNKTSLKKDMVEFDSFACFVNHSCDTNAYSFPNDDISDDGFTNTMIARRDIQPGEYISEDYDSYEEELYAVIDPCHCGSGKCRGRVQGFNHISFPQQCEMLPMLDESLRKVPSD